MAACSACNTTIIFGGVREGDRRYCNANCRNRGAVLERLLDFPAEVVRAEARRLFHSRCPKCGGPGPVDVQNSYRVMSFLLLTQWKTTPLIACRSCGRKAQAGGAVISLLIGWWGFPWGLIMTPVQIGRNLAAMFRDEPQQPTPDLERAVRVMLAARPPQDRAEAAAGAHWRT